MQMYDNAFYSGLLGTQAPQSALYQSIVQNGLTGTAQAIGSNLINTAQAVANGNPTAIGSLAGGVAVGEALGGLTGAAEAGVDSAGADALASATNNIDELGSFTATGSQITNGSGITVVGSDPVSLRVASNVAPLNGAFDVVVHGVPYDDAGAVFSVDGLPTNANQIAEAILSNPTWNGQPIRLLTCYGGCGPVQELSDILGVPVQGATAPVGVPQVPNSAPIVRQGGQWLNFFPTGSSK